MRLFTYLLRALCAIAAGFLLVSNPSTMANLLIQIVGGLFALSGIAAFLGYFSSRMNRGSALRPVFPLVGIGSLAFGVVLLLWPEFFKEVFMYVIGALLLLLGLNQMWSLFVNRKVAPVSFSLFLIPLLVVVAAGVMILLYPTESASLPFLVLGIAAIFYGVNELFVGIRLWRMQKAYDAQFVEAEEIKVSDDADIPEATLLTDTTTSQS